MGSNHAHLELNYMNKKSVYKLLQKAKPPGFSCWCGGPSHTENCNYIRNWVKDYEINHLAYNKIKTTKERVGDQK